LCIYRTEIKLTNSLLRGSANKHGASHNIAMEREKNDKSSLKMFLYGFKYYKTKKLRQIEKMLHELFSQLKGIK